MKAHSFFILLILGFAGVAQTHASSKTTASDNDKAIVFSLDGQWELVIRLDAVGADQRLGQRIVSRAHLSADNGVAVDHCN